MLKILNVFYFVALAFACWQFLIFGFFLNNMKFNQSLKLNTANKVGLVLVHIFYLGVSSYVGIIFFHCPFSIDISPSLGLSVVTNLFMRYLKKEILNQVEEDIKKQGIVVDKSRSDSITLKSYTKFFKIVLIISNSIVIIILFSYIITYMLK